MPVWIDSLGIASIGVVYGYVLFYALKRYMPPTTQAPLTVKELLLLLTTLGLSGGISAAFVSVNGINQIGPYGIGLLIGSATNVGLSLWLEKKSLTLTRPRVSNQG